MEKRLPAIEMEEVTDAGDLAAARKQREQFDRNSAWLQRHIPEVYANHRGRCICVAGEEVFAADSAAEATELARAAHPKEEGWFTRYIPKEKVARIYAVCTEHERLDMSVLGRDLLEMFAVIVDRRAEVIALIGGQHRYTIHRE